MEKYPEGERVMFGCVPDTRKYWSRLGGGEQETNST